MDLSKSLVLILEYVIVKVSFLRTKERNSIVNLNSCQESIEIETLQMSAFKLRLQFTKKVVKIFWLKILDVDVLDTNKKYNELFLIEIISHDPWILYVQIMDSTRG